MKVMWTNNVTFSIKVTAIRIFGLQTHEVVDWNWKKIVFFFFFLVGTANLPVIDSPLSSLGSIDDSLVMGNLESSFPSSSAVMGEVGGEIRGFEQVEESTSSCCNHTTAALQAQIAQLEVRCQRLQEEKKVSTMQVAIKTRERKERIISQIH